MIGKLFYTFSVNVMFYYTYFLIEVYEIEIS